jgi:hypothetical protein
MPHSSSLSRTTLFLSIFLALLHAGAVLAQDDEIPDHPMMTDTWFIGVGALWADSNVTGSLNRGRLAGAILDFEDDLGLDEENFVGVLTVRAHFAERWRFEAEYFKLDRDNERLISRTVDWGEETIPIDAAVRSTFDLEDTRVSFGYSFFRTKDKEVGIGLGAHVTRLEASLSTQRRAGQAAAETAPLPFVTVYARMALTDRWLLNIRVDRLSLDTGSIDGKVFSSGTEFVYQPWRHFNIALGYRDINYQISSTSEDWNGKAQVQQSGPILMISSTF